MKDVKKTVLWVLVGFCMISVLVGIFSLFAFLPMVTNNISTLSSAGEKEENFFVVSTLAAILCAIVGVAFVVFAIMQVLKHNKPEQYKTVCIFLIVTLVICVLFVVYSFLTLTILKAGDDVFKISYDDYIYYGSFVLYQSYLSAILSTFLPLFIAAGLVFGNVIMDNVHVKNAE